MMINMHIIGLTTQRMETTHEGIYRYTYLQNQSRIRARVYHRNEIETESEPEMFLVFCSFL
jgi:hypothetical protein